MSNRPVYSVQHASPTILAGTRTFAQDRAVTLLGDLPLFIVSAAGFLNMPFIQDAAARQRMQHLWNELQADLIFLIIAKHMGKRNRAILAILLGCGLRRRELAELELERLQRREERWVIVDLICKGRHIRTVPVPNWVSRYFVHLAK